MQTIDHIERILMELKLHGVRASWRGRVKEALAGDVAYEDFISLILADESEYRRNRRVTRLTKRAAFRQAASPESIDFTTARGLDKKLVADLTGCRFVMDGTNVIVEGPTGVGKTFLASAIGHAACRQGYSTLFYRMNALVEQTTLARAKGTYLNLVKRLAGADLLILDDFGIKPLAPQQYQDLYDVLDERTEGKATVITTQLPPENWSEVIDDEVTCEAVTDRLVSKATVVRMKGSSYRARAAKKASAIDKV